MIGSTHAEASLRGKGEGLLGKSGLSAGGVQDACGGVDSVRGVVVADDSHRDEVRKPGMVNHGDGGERRNLEIRGFYLSNIPGAPASRDLVSTSMPMAWMGCG